jgi:hypothetical protein
MIITEQIRQLCQKFLELYDAKDTGAYELVGVHTTLVRTFGYWCPLAEMAHICRKVLEPKPGDVRTEVVAIADRLLKDKADLWKALAQDD